MTRFNYIVLRVALAFGLITLVPVYALAQGTMVDTAAHSSTTPVSVNGAANAAANAKLGAAAVKAKANGDKEIDRRVAALTDLNARIQAMQKVTDAFKQGISASITNEINTLNALKAKIDADTDLETLKADVKSITGSYRVFALVIPQGRIAATADREVELVSMMSTLGSKLQARVQAAQQSGGDVTALTAALTDMAAKLQDAQTKAEAAVTASSSLTPDNGDAAKMKTNNAALAEARTNLKASKTSLEAARKDVATIIAGLGKVKAAANASSSAQTTASTTAR